MGPGYPADRFLSPVHVTEGGGSAAVSHSEQSRGGRRRVSVGCCRAGGQEPR